MTKLGDFAPLDEALEDLTSRIDMPARKGMARRVATDLRASNAKRIRANQTPDGSPMEPRKPRRDKKRLAQVKMFRGAVKPAYLRKESSAAGATVGFAGAMARIMRVHHDGLRDKVSRDPKSPSVDYPARPVLGLTPDDRSRILDQVVAQLQA